MYYGEFENREYRLENYIVCGGKVAMFTFLREPWKGGLLVSEKKGGTV